MADHERDPRGADGETRTPPTGAAQGRSLPELVEDAFSHAAGLIRDEVRLARAEIVDGVRTMRGGALSAGLGVAILTPAITVLLGGVALGMAAAGWVPAWAGALIVGGLAAIVGAILLKTGASRMDPSNLAAPKATADAARTARMAREQAR